MTTKRRHWRVAASALLLLAACGGSGDDLPDTLRLLDDPSSTLLMIDNAGGFVPVEFLVGQGPALVLQRDGTVIAPGPQIEIFPGPLLQNWQTTQLDEETMLFVLEELDTLDFVNIDHVENNDVTGVADAPTTTVTFFNEDGQHSFSVYALGIGQETSDPRVPILANLVQELYDATAFGGGQAYEPETIQVVAAAAEGLFDPNDPTVNFKEWPLPVAFEDMETLEIEGWRCTTFEGVDAEELLAIFAESNQATYFTAGDIDYRLLVRPLFAPEEPCDQSLT